MYYNQRDLDYFARILRDLYSRVNPNGEVARLALQLSQALYDDTAELEEDAVVKGVTSLLEQIESERKAQEAERKVRKVVKK